MTLLGEEQTMRYRLKSRRPAPPRRPKPPAPPEGPRPAALDNPYGRYYTRPRSFAELLHRKPEH